MQLTGQKRVLTGKKSASLRAERFIPAVIFGKGLESTSVTVGYNEFTKMFAQTGETSVFDLIIEGKKHGCPEYKDEGILVGGADQRWRIKNSSQPRRV